MGVCICGFCIVWVCVCVGFVMCVCEGFLLCGCVDLCGCVGLCMCVFVCGGFLMCGCFVNMCTCIYCVFILFRLCLFIPIYYYFKDYCHRLKTQLL